MNCDFHTWKLQNGDREPQKKFLMQAYMIQKK